MRLVSRSLLVCVLGVLLGGFSQGLVAVAAEPHGEEVSSPGSSLTGAPLVVAGADHLVGGEQSRAAREAKRRNPAAVAARQASRTSFAGLTPAQAASEARTAFPGLIEHPAGGAPQLPAGQRITGFANAYAAQVDLGGGQHALVDSTVPIAKKGSSGAWAPVDLSLHESGDGFEGDDPLVAARLPKRLSEGAQLPAIGLSVTPVDAQGAPLPGAASTIDGSSVFVANTLPDSDTVLKPSTFGLALDTLLRSPDSPQQLSFRVGVPAGARLVEDDHVPGVVRVVKEGKTIATMPSPFAHDAAGANVPVSVHVSGDVVTLTVAHRSGDYLYPIMVDPEFNYYYNGGVGLAASYWPFTTSGAFEGYYESPYAMGIRPLYSGQSPGSWGAFNYQTKGVSKLMYIEASTYISEVWVLGSELYEPITGEYYIEFANSSGTEIHWTVGAVGEYLFTDPVSSFVCAQPSCSQENVAAGNTVRFVLRATQSGPPPHPEFAVLQARIGIAQPKETHSTVSYNTTSPEIEYTSGGKPVKTPNVLYGGGAWIGPHSGAFEFKSEDAGLGVSATNVSTLNSFTWKERVKRNYLTEGGCVDVQCGASQKEVVTYSQLSSGLVNGGENTIRVAASDPMSNTWSSEHGEGLQNLKVDATAPHGITLSGLPGAGGIYELDEATVGHAKIEASDGEGSTASSGIKSLAVSVDGREIGAPAGSCTPGPCSASGEWAVNGSEIGAGSHVLTVVATDNAGNVGQKEYLLNVHAASPVAAGPGSVDPESGNFALEATDVGMSGGEGNLTVSRYYNSRFPQEGAEGPLGPQWTISLSSLASLEVLPDGSVLVAGPEGLVHFSVKAGGGFEAPVGDTNLKLEAVTQAGKIVAYVFKNPAKGTTTKFTLPSGAETWMPTVSEGPIATSTTTDEYTTAEPEAGKKIVEPILEVAPHPSATCTYKHLEKGCRALEFNYATSTTAGGESQSLWGDYKGNLTRVYFIAWDPASKEVTTTTVAQYSYDSKGRLRAEWDPRISPALKTTYGYDAEGHITAVSPAGQQPWVLGYGTTSSDATAGRLVTAGRPVVATALGNGIAPANTAAPQLSVPHPAPGKAVSVVAGTWSNSPLRYGYQWERCNYSGGSCVPIGGAINREYTPTQGDVGSTLLARVSATNAAGTVSMVSAASLVGPQQVAEFGSSGSGNGQLKSPAGIALDSKWNAWVADAGNNRIEEFNSSGSFVRTAGTSGSGLLSDPEAVAVDSANNVWVADTGNNRVVEFNSSGEYVKAFGSLGSGNGQFKTPWGIAIDGAGHVWVSDSSNVRLQEFTSAGAWMRNVGKQGSEEGYLSWPGQLTIDSSNNVWVADPGNNRITEYSNEGVYIRQFGTAGTGNGQFTHPGPWGIGIDGAGHVWASDTNHNRVEVFSATGEFIQAFGSTGSGSGQFNAPDAITFSSNGYVYIVDQSNNRVTKWSDGAPSPISEFGTAGSGNGQLKAPWGIARDSNGNVWVGDTLNNRIEEFNSSGSFVRTAGTSGSGLLSNPEAVAVDSVNNVWVTDTAHNRVVEFNPGGAYLRAFGSLGSGNGQFKTPWGVAVDPAGHIWVSDSGNVRIQEFSASGAWIRNVGKQGTEEGYLSWPGGIATDASGDVWVADPGNNRITEYSNEGVFIRQFGSLGTGNGQFNGGPWGIAVDPAGHVWASDFNDNRVEVFSSTGAFTGQFGQHGSALGQFSGVGQIAIAPGGEVFVSDVEDNRITKWSGASYWEGMGTSGPETALPASATSTIEYGVPVSGAGAPYAMSATDVAKWAQTDVPTQATAILPPDASQGWPAGDYKRAVVDYMDARARTTNMAAPGGGISTSEFNEYNDEVRTLSAANRAKALAEGANSAEVAKQLDTESVFTEEGSRLTEKLGPQHTVKIAKGNEKVASGSEIPAREHTKYYYDEGAPANGETFNLVTKTTDGAETAAKEELDVRTTTTSYSGQSNLGWKLRKPTSTTIDPAGLKITHTTVYNETTGAVLETRGPASTGTGDPHDQLTIYYTAGANSTYPACGEHIEWSGLPCETLPGKQPETSGLPPLPVTTTTYDVWDQPEKIVEAFGSTTRTKKTSFDGAGRPVTSRVTSTSDTALPTVSYKYDESLGALRTESVTFEGQEKAITMLHNKLGQLYSYTDADGATATYSFDVDGRVTEQSELIKAGVSGSQTYAYDPTSGRMTQLVDSGAGTFTAAYDVAGNMTSENYPNKMTEAYTRNSVGAVTGIEYTKTAHCASSCPERWFGDSLVPSIHGEALKEASTLSEEPKESYDAAGRLTEVQEIPVGKGCTTRIYGYEQESNRLSLTTRAPGGEGKCATEGGSVENHSYDSGNRLTDSGVTYETFGNITKLPAADAGGMEVTSSYYTSNQVASQQQNGVTTSYYMDPAGRLRETRSPGVSVTHYADSGSAAAWVMEPESKWTRNIPGIDGSLTATQTSSGAVTLLLHDVHGDVVGKAALSESETKLLSTYNSTEFGVPSSGAPPKFAWLGAAGVASESPTGMIVQNGSAYVPQTGSPLQTQGLVLPTPDDMITPYAMILSPWVIEGTAAMARQLTAAEEAARAVGESPDPAGFLTDAQAKWAGHKLILDAEGEEAYTDATLVLSLMDGIVEWLAGELIEQYVGTEEIIDWTHKFGAKLLGCSNGYKVGLRWCRVRWKLDHVGPLFEFPDYGFVPEVEECYDNSLAGYCQRVPHK